MSPDDAERAFIEFVRSHSTRLYSHTYCRCGNKQLAEDTLQDAFVRVWKAWPNVADQNGVPLKYLLTVIDRLLVDHHRKTKSRDGKPRPEEVAWDDERDGQLPDACNVAEEATFRALSRDLRAALATLETIQQDLITLIYFGQLPKATAAKELGLTESTAHRYHNAALSRLREMIGHGKGEGPG